MQTEEQLFLKIDEGKAFHMVPPTGRFLKVLVQTIDYEL